MLKQRVMTAVVLMCVLLPALLLPIMWPFAGLTVLLIAAAGWEWGRLNGAGALSLPLGVLLAGACAVARWMGWDHTPAPWVWWGVAAAWGVLGAVALTGGASRWSLWPTWLRWFLGLAMLWTTWSALLLAKSMGSNFILSIFALVWAADIAAYFGGKAWGKRKLAPKISPGKSWEGVASGMAGALCLAALWCWADTVFKPDSVSLYTHLYQRLGVLNAASAVLCLVGLSVMGDLFESLVKRAAGAKDSSRLLPGHGGVLDRIDALLPVLPLALVFVT
jgi:phosphatidate cytidylyltransferase